MKPRGGFAIRVMRERYLRGLAEGAELVSDGHQVLVHPRHPGLVVPEG